MRQWHGDQLEVLWLEGCWVAQSVEWPNLGFGSGCDLRVMKLSPALGSVLSTESAWVSLPPSCSLSLSNKQIFKKKKKKGNKTKGGQLPGASTEPNCQKTSLRHLYQSEKWAFAFGIKKKQNKQTTEKCEQFLSIILSRRLYPYGHFL